MDHGPVIGILLHDFALGGSERVAIRLANAWSQMGCTVILCVGNDTGPQRGLVGPGVEIDIADPPIRRSALSRAALGRWLGEHCRARGIDAVFLPGNFYIQACRPIARAAGRQLPIYAKISNVQWRPERLLLTNLIIAGRARYSLTRARAVFAMSPGLALQARRVLGRSQRIEIVPNPVFEVLPPLEEEHRRPWHICAVGRLVQQKNFRLLLDSLALITDLPVMLTIAGEGEQARELVRRAAALGITERVRFVGAVDDVHRLVAEAEVLLLTSDFEGYPAVIIEALAAGTYVIARNCSPAIPEILASADVGRCVESDEPGDFAAALRSYFALRNRDTARMRDVAAGHVTEAAARQYLQAFGFATPD